MTDRSAGMRVLVADDDPVTVRVGTAWLERWGYHPVTATTSEDALSALLGEDAPRGDGDGDGEATAHDTGDAAW